MFGRLYHFSAHSFLLLLFLYSFYLRFLYNTLSDDYKMAGSNNHGKCRKHLHFIELAKKEYSSKKLFNYLKSPEQVVLLLVLGSR
jgi:hypothetical protein